MQITGIETGVDFENYTMDLFQRAGIEVHDTPKTNDYGADVLVVYKGVKFAGQCKYYSKSVGVKAVQEIIGALNYYQAQYGMVITNDSFTQQAKNLAATNRVLLIDGEQLTSPSFVEEIAAILDDFMEKVRQSAPIYQAEEDWVINDLVIRYGVSQAKILKDFLGGGLPYYKVGREYRFNPQKVKEWEIQKQCISYGKNGIIELPEYKNNRLDDIKKRNELIQQYNFAEKNGDFAKIEQLTEEMHKLRMQTPKEICEKLKEAEIASKKATKKAIIISAFVLLILIGVSIITYLVVTKTDLIRLKW